jgi:TRAP-type C4-dicarboxylate transport system permease small subunit
MHTGQVMQHITTEQARAIPTPPIAVRAVLATSKTTLTVERWLITGLMFLLTFLILLNVVTRYSGASLYWVDESAVYSVVWLTFIGGSAMTRLRMDFAVEMLTDKLSPSYKKIAKITAGLGIAIFSIGLAWMCLLWFDPIGFAQAGFEPKAFAAKSFNFLYTERTQTLNWPSWAVYLIIPIFSITMVIHSVANLLEDMGFAQVSKFKEFGLNNAESIN